jgi:hypothetical protein
MVSNGLARPTVGLLIVALAVALPACRDDLLGPLGSEQKQTADEELAPSNPLDSVHQLLTDPFVRPIAVRLAGEALVEEIEASEIPFQFGFQRRFDAAYVEARRRVASGELGTVYLTRNAVPQDGNLTYSHTQFGSRLQWPGGASGGTNLHRNVASQPWEFRQGGSPVASSVVYRGFNLNGEEVALKHDIVAGNTVVNVLETPEYVAVGGNPGLRRTINVSGLGSGQSLRLHLSGEVRPETWTVQSGGTLEGTNPVYLNISANGTAVVTGSWQP